MSDHQNTQLCRCTYTERREFWHCYKTISDSRAIQPKHHSRGRTSARVA